MENDRSIFLSKYYYILAPCLHVFTPQFHLFLPLLLAPYVCKQNKGREISNQVCQVPGYVCTLFYCWVWLLIIKYQSPYFDMQAYSWPHWVGSKLYSDKNIITHLCKSFVLFRTWHIAGIVKYSLNEWMKKISIQYRRDYDRATISLLLLSQTRRAIVGYAVCQGQ